MKRAAEAALPLSIDRPLLLDLLDHAAAARLDDIDIIATVDVTVSPDGRHRAIDIGRELLDFDGLGSVLADDDATFTARRGAGGGRRPRRRVFADIVPVLLRQVEL